MESTIAYCPVSDQLAAAMEGGAADDFCGGASGVREDPAGRRGQVGWVEEVNIEKLGVGVGKAHREETLEGEEGERAGREAGG